MVNKTSDSEEEPRLRLANIKEAVGIPTECDDDVVVVQKRKNEDAVWKELLIHPTPTVRHILMAGIGIYFFQQASRIDAIVLYSPKIFNKVGITNKDHVLLTTIAVGLVKTVFILVATFLIDRLGRRPLLLSSFAGMILSLATLGISLTIIDHSDEKLTWDLLITILAVLAYVATFSIGAGPITWVYSSEISLLRLRAQGTSMGVTTNRLVSGIISMTFLSLTKAISIGGGLFLFMGIAVVAFVFFFTLLPKTRGRTLEDMQVLFGTFFRWRTTTRELKKGNKPATTDWSNTGKSEIQMG